MSDLPASYDLEGFNMRVLMRENNGTGTSMFVIAPEETDGEILNDTIFNRNLALYERYNFGIENVYTGEKVLEVAERSILARDDEFEVVFPYFDNAAMKVNTGIFLDMNTVENLNLKKNYWDQNFNSAVSLGGKLYCGVGDIMVSEDDVMMMVLYNSDLANDLGIENLYTAVDERRWTYELMRGYVKQVATDLDGDGKMGRDDMVGFLWASNNCLAPHLAAANTLLFTKDDSDTPVMTKNLDKAYRIFDYLGELLDQKRYSLDWLNFGDAVTVITNLVSTKHVLFQNMVLSQLRRLYRDVTANFGMLPMPKLEENQSDYHTTIWKSFEAIMLPATNTRLSETGFALEALAAASDNIGETYYNICLESKYTRDAESIRMIELARKNMLYDIGFIYDWGGLYSSLNSAMATGKSANAASIIASTSEKAELESKEFLSELK